MSKQDRRDFLKTTAALAGASVLPNVPVTAAVKAAATIPPHRPLQLSGVHAYTDKLSVAAGDNIRFHVSSTHPYRLEVCRLGLDVDDPRGDEILQSWDVSNPSAQPIHPGSYIHVASGLPAEQELKSLTLECWVRRWQTKGRQGLITQYDLPRSCGFGLFIEEDGSVSFYLGDGMTPVRGVKNLHRTAADLLSAPGKKKDYAFPAGSWHHVVATYNGREKAMWVDGRLAGRWETDVRARPGAAPLRIGAAGRQGLADFFLDADIAMPAVYDVALSEAVIKQRYKEARDTPAKGDQVLACWPLEEENGDRVADVSRHGRHGRIINHATWMIGGPGFNAGRDPYVEYDPMKDTNRGHGLRLASDDLIDCRWKSTHEFRLPEDAKSGIYVGRIHFEQGNEQRLHHTMFIVKKAAARPKAPIAFLCSTNTWKAYSATPFCDAWPGLKQSIGNQGYKPSPNDPVAYCFYRPHAAGQPAFHVGWRTPWPVVGPYVLVEDLDYSHLVRADRFTQAWLEQHGYDYDVYSDWDVHRDPDLLNGYKALFIVGHSEYWSREAYENVRKYLSAGGNVVALSGNTMYWRVSFNEDGSVMECRKVDGWGAQIPPERHAECYHTDDSRRGGTLRECGFPAWQLLGLEFMGSVSMGSAAKGKVGPYRIKTADHFLFQKPQRLDVKPGDLIAGNPADPARQPIGHEVDALPSTMKRNLRKPPPAGSLPHPEDPPGIITLAEAVHRAAKGQAYAWDYYHRNHDYQDDVMGEMIYWQRPDGGRVFNAGSIAAGWTLAVDPKWTGLLKNVLFHFGVEPGKRGPEK